MDVSTAPSPELARRAPDRASFVDINRTRLRVWEWGDEDAPPIICVHGAYDHGRMWDGFAPRLVEGLGCRVLAPDLRGHGDSGPLGTGHVWLTTALDLGLLARHAGHGRPVGLVGHSFGAGIAMYTAGVWPELVRWVVNIDGLGPGGGDGPPEDWDIAANAARSFDNTARVLLSPPRRYASQADMVERRAGVNVRLPRPWVEHLVEHGSIPDGSGGFRWKADPVFRSGFPGDWGIEYFHAENAMLRAPMLVLSGDEHDTWSEYSGAEVEARVLRDFAAAANDVRHETILAAGHYAHIEQPEAVLDAIRRFVADVGAHA